MKKLVFGLMLLLGVSLYSQNLVINSDFSINAMRRAMMWKTTFRGESNGVKYVWEAGKGHYEIASDIPISPCIRQYGLILVPGEKYRIACDISAENLTYGKLWCVVANYGWKKDAGLKQEAGTLTTDGIRHLEATFVAPTSPNDSFSIAFYLSEATGKCNVYGLSLEPLTEKGRLGSGNNFKFDNAIMGILAVDRMAIPREQDKLDITLANVMGDAPTLQAEIDGKPLPEQTFKNFKATIDISAYKTGKHHLVLKALQNGKLLRQREEDFAFAAPLPSFHHTRKGFTEELLNCKVNGKREFEFVAPTDGWFFIRVETPSGKIVSAVLDDAVVLYPEGSYRNETMRNLVRGVHKICFKEDVTGSLQVRAVPLTLKYAGVTKQVSFPSMPPYDWEWHKKHVVGRSASFGPDGIKPDCLAESKLFGVTFARRYHVNRTQQYGQAQAEETLVDFNTSRALLDPDTYYVGMDEYEWSDFGALLNFSDISDRVVNPHKKYIMHWMASHEGPSLPGVHHYIIEQFLNMGGAKGLLAYELYFGTRKTEEEARKMITASLQSVVEDMEEFFPGSAAKTLLCFSNMNHPTYITSAIHPHVNLKYLMDLEMYLLANAPAGSKIGGVGYWGCHYADADVNLWTQELYRHYCCDGNTEMLSKQYGFTYILPHITNGSFHDGLNGFVAKGEVSTDRLPGFGKRSMCMWGGGQEAGDTVAVLSPGASLETTAVQLDPNATYKLEYVAADYEDVKKNVIDPKVIPVNLQLKNAELLMECSQVDNLQKKRANYPRIHYYVKHFRPNSTTMPMLFTCDSQDGRKCTLNFIKIEPLFVKK